MGTQTLSHSLSHTLHTNRKHTIQLYDELTAADEPHPPSSQRASTIPTTYLYRSTMLSRSLIYGRLLVGRRQHPPSSLPIRFRSSFALKESINAKFSSSTTNYKCFKIVLQK